LLPLASPGGQIVLTNGEILEGEILEKTATGVRIRTTRTTLTIPRERIREVRESAPGAVALLKARDALDRGQIDQANAFVQSAETEGGDPQEIATVRALISAEVSRRELARYASLLQDARAAAAAGANHPALQEVRQLIATMEPDSLTRRELTEILISFHQARAMDARDKVRTQEAAQELQEIIKLDPNRPDPHLDLGDLYRSSSATWDQAILHYTTAIKLGAERLPENSVTRAYFEMAEISRQQKRWREAAANYRQAYQRNPQYNPRLTDRLVEAMREFAAELRSQGNHAMALAVADTGLQARSEADLHMLRAECLASLGRYAESTEAVQAALALTPRIRGANYRIALNFRALGENLSTREYLQREISAFPNNYDALNLLGQFALERDDHESALRFFSDARRVDRDLPDATLGLSKTYRRQKQLQRAREMALEVLARFPEDRAANLEMGNIFLDEGNFEEARRYFTAVLELVDKALVDINNRTPRAELDQLKADALIARGEVQLLTAGPGTAAGDFRKALESVPDYPQAFFAIGNAYRKKFASSKSVADLKEAETNLLKARELLPSNPQYALELGILYAQELAQTDKDNESLYRSKAVQNWQDYLNLGGANAPQVQAWIKEIQG
jgi:tetratricopeptide (TPR) repeat protein